MRDEHGTLPGDKTNDPAFDLKRKNTGYVLLAIVLVTSILNLIGWLLEIPARDVPQAWTTMKPVTAISFILSSSSIIMLNVPVAEKYRNFFASFSALVIILVGALTFYGHLSFYSTGHENQLSSFPLLDRFLQRGSRMAFVTSILFMAVGLIIILHMFHNDKLNGISHSLIIPVLILSYFVPMSYSLGITTIYLVNDIAVSLHAGINFILLGSAILLFYPQTWLMRVLLDKYSGGNMARRMIPGILIVPVVISWLRLKGEQAHIFSSETGIVLVGVTYTFCLLAIVWFSARRVIKLDSIRQVLDDSLREKEEKHRQELAAQAHFITSVTETVPDMLSILELPSRKPIYTNTEPFYQQGFVSDEIKKMTPRERQMLIHPDDRDALDSFFLNVTNLSNNDVVSLEYRAKNMNDEWVWFRVRSKVFERAVDGKVKSCINTIQNITAEKEAEIRVQKSESRFRTLADNISQLVWILDEQGKFSWFNKQWFDYTGITLEEMKNGALTTILHPDYAQQVAERFGNAMIKGEPWSDIFPMRNRNGEYRWFLNQALPIYDEEGRIVSWFGTNTDIHEQKIAEEKAVLLASQVEAILTCIPVGVIVYDPEAKIIRKNSTAEKILEYPSEGFDLPYTERLTKLIEIWDEDGHKLNPPDMPAYKAAVNGETTINQVLLFRSRFHASWISVSAAPLILGGKHAGGVISMLDITDLKKTEEALRHSREELKSITDNSPDVIARLDLSLRHIFINPYGEKVYGKTRDQIIGKTNAELGMPNDKVDFWKKNFEAVLTSGEQMNVEFEFESPGFGHQHFHSIFVPERDGSGSIGSILAITRDITRLKEIEQKFRTLFENISEGVALHEIVYDGDKPVNYRIIDVNPAYKNIIGIDTYKAIGSLATDLYQTEEPPFFDIYLNVATTQKAHRFEIHYAQLDRYFMIDAVSPRKGQFATVFEDITEQKRTEYEIKKKNEELTRFIYTVSHDLKSPLVTIKSFTSYLKEDIENQDRQGFEKDIRYIENAADKMGNLLNELLGLSRIGRKEEPKTAVPMKTLAQHAIDLVAGRITNAKAKVIITGPDVMLYGHTQRLLQLYQNLIDNAVKFMGDQPEPLIEIGSLSDPAGHIVMFVRDNGSGIDPRFHEKVFGLFEKLDNNTEGTGIGLALIKRIVEIHNGSVWFNSEGEGKGTTFYFTLEKSYIIE